MRAKVAKSYTLRDCARACSLHNHLTNPCAMLSDFEHGIRRKAARKVYRFLQSRFSKWDWSESDSGRLYAGDWGAR